VSEFLILKSAAEARALLEEFPPVGLEPCPLPVAGGRVLAEDVRAPEPLPAFSRATMDGYAVRASDLFGASDGAPAYLRVVGQLPMGEAPAAPLGAGEALGISTGGMLPDGADAVVMIEWTQRIGPSEVEVFRPVAPGENVIGVGDDVRAGEPVCHAGGRLRPQDVALLAALGVVELPVHRLPRVAVLSTGNELSPPHERPGPARVRDANQLALAEAVRRAGGEPTCGGIIADDAGELARAVAAASERADLVLLSGGSSVGVRDLTAQTLAALGEICFHGISVRPGRPTLLARAKSGAPLVGMPGPPTSALVIFDVFIRPLLFRLGGQRERDLWPLRVRARLTRRQASVAGREDWIRVRLLRDPQGDWLAEPLRGSSAALSNLTRADGYLCIEAGCEGVAEGETVEVRRFEPT
jgi:molybdopterin molybdotransferase